MVWIEDVYSGYIKNYSVFVCFEIQYLAAEAAKIMKGEFFIRFLKDGEFSKLYLGRKASKNTQRSSHIKSINMVVYEQKIPFLDSSSGYSQKACTLIIIAL